LSPASRDKFNETLTVLKILTEVSGVSGEKVENSNKLKKENK